MAFNVHQGGEQTDAIQWAYDGIPIVTENTDEGLYPNHVYLCRAYYWTGTAWASLGVISSRGNQVNFGVFDVQSLMLSGYRIAQGALQTLDTESTYGDNIQTYAGREWYVKVDLGWQSDTTAATYPATKYYRLIGGALTDQFTSWADRNYTNYVFKATEGSFMTMRPSRAMPALIYGGRPMVHVDVMPYDRYSVTYMACKKKSGVGDNTWNSNIDKFRVKVVTGGGVNIDVFTITNLDSIDVDSQSVPQSANAFVLREVNFGPRDIMSLKEGTTYLYSGTVRGAVALGTWDYIDLEPLNSGSTTTGNQIVRLHNAKNKSGGPCAGTEQVQFKFRNRLGGFDYISCTTYVKRRLNITREKHGRRDTNYNDANNVIDIETNDVHAFSNVSRVTELVDTYTASTGYVDEDMNAVVRALMTSQEVYVTKFVDNDTGVDAAPSFYPCLITSTDMSYMYRVTDKLIEYTFDFEYSNAPRPLL